MHSLTIPDLAGKVFLVTGASTGIGAAVARALGLQGAFVAVHYNSSVDEAREVATAINDAGGRSFLIRSDIGTPDGAAIAVEAAANHFGRLDGLINNAGGLIHRRLIAEGDDAFEKAVFDLNAHSVVRATRAALPWLKRNGGAIINTTSIAARVGGAGGSILYASAKGFVSTFTRGLAKEVVKDRIRVNAVSPGLIATPFHDRYTSPDLFKALEGSIPMGHAGTAQDCVSAYLFLASDALSGYLTGQIIEVNGGQLMP
jgi:3-oxoacyl-[acyl-carrier protein] reductase